MQSLEYLESEPRGQAEASVIWLHGLGADGHDFLPIVPYLGLSEKGVRFVFPHAPQRPVTINMGLVMRAWYDIRQLDLRRDHDERGIAESTAAVGALVEREIERGVPPGKIVLAGFSQGGAVALHTALRFAERLAGALVLSAYLLRAENLAEEAAPANRGLPIFQGHGSADDIVPMPRGAECRDRLTASGYPVEWRTYEIGHEVNADEIRDVGAWLDAALFDVG